MLLVLASCIPIFEQSPDRKCHPNTIQSAHLFIKGGQGRDGAENNLSSTVLILLGATKLKHDVTVTSVDTEVTAGRHDQ